MRSVLAGSRRRPVRKECGRAGGAAPVVRTGHEALKLSDDELRRRIEAGLIWLWQDAHGEVGHVTGCSAPVFGVARIGPVYTPPEQRGGYAAAAVSQVCQQVLAGGDRVCLYTALDNPVSNALYARLGFRPVADRATLRVVQ